MKWSQPRARRSPPHRAAGRSPATSRARRRMVRRQTPIGEPRGPVTSGAGRIATALEPGLEQADVLVGAWRARRRGSAPGPRRAPSASRSAGKRPIRSSTTAWIRSAFCWNTSRTLVASTASVPSMDARVVVGDQADVDDRHPELAAQPRLRVLGHVDDLPAGVAEPLRLGLGREPRPCDDDDRAALVDLDAVVADRLDGQVAAGPGRRSRPTRGGSRSGRRRRCRSGPLVRSTNWSQTTKSPGLTCELERAGGARRDDRLDPERAHRPDVGPVVDPCGGIVWRRPWRGRNATRRPATSARKTESDGGPYGVSTLISRTSSSSE